MELLGQRKETFFKLLIHMAKKLCRCLLPPWEWSFPASTPPLGFIVFQNLYSQAWPLLLNISYLFLFSFSARSLRDLWSQALGFETVICFSSLLNIQLNMVVTSVFHTFCLCSLDRWVADEVVLSWLSFGHQLSHFHFLLSQSNRICPSFASTLALLGIGISVHHKTSFQMT